MRLVVTSFVLICLHVFSKDKDKTKAELTTGSANHNFSRSSLECSDVILEKSIEYRGNYMVLRNYVSAERQFKCLESVTLTLPGDYRFLDNILPQIERWQGPISVALYAPGYDFFSTLQSIAYLRQCSKLSSLVKEYVTFHVFLDVDHIPIHDKPLMTIYQDDFDCSQKPPYETVKDSEMYKQRMGLFYPINVARNVAKLNVQTHFVFPSDIELYATRQFIPKFFNFTQKHSNYFLKGSANVFVLPLFEIQEGLEIPEDKTKLQKMLSKGTAQWFHQKVCRRCHELPKSEEWIAKNETKGLNIFTSSKRQGNQKIWEPFFICTGKEPLWDERLNWEGQGNKMCQAYHLCMLDYNFLVFDNAFLIHKPGVKKKKVQNIKFKSQTEVNNAILRHIAKELTEIYGNKSECKIHNVFPKPNLPTAPNK